MHALDKAEEASRALKEVPPEPQLEERDEEDDELVQSLERARQVALKTAPKGTPLSKGVVTLFSCVRNGPVFREGLVRTP